jgi:hypothetical protein
MVLSTKEKGHHRYHSNQHQQLCNVNYSLPPDVSSLTSSRDEREHEIIKAVK